MYKMYDFYLFFVEELFRHIHLLNLGCIINPLRFTMSYILFAMERIKTKVTITKSRVICLQDLLTSAKEASKVDVAKAILLGGCYLLWVVS